MHVRQVLTKLQENQLYVKGGKCEFHMSSTAFLGYVIGPEGVSIDQDKVRVVTDWATPTSVENIQRCIGFANFYRRFIHGFSSIAAPITALLKKNT